MCVEPQMNIAPNKCTIYTFMRYICQNIQSAAVILTFEERKTRFDTQEFC